MKRLKNVPRWGCIFLCVAFALCLLPGTGLAASPVPPMQPYGYVTINGERAENGVPVTARMWSDAEQRWIEYGPHLTYTGGPLGEQGYYEFPVGGGIPKTDDDGKVHFYVYGIEHKSSPKTWHSGDRRVDLEITKAHLDTVIVSPAEGDTFSTLQPFEVVATVTNIGMEPATEVSAEIAFPLGNAEAEDTPTVDPPGTTMVDVGETVTYTWSAECTDWGPTEITVTPDGLTPDGSWPPGGVVPIPDDNLEVGMVTVRQEEKIHLTVTDVWTNLEQNEDLIDTASTEQVFEVYATVENRMIAVTDPDWKAIAEKVEATLTATGDVTIAEPTQVSPVDLGGGESVMLTWTVTCDGAGDVVFTVTPDGEDENTNEPVIAPDNIDTETHAIRQEEKIHLTVTDVWTNLEDDTASTEQVFEVYATVENRMIAVTDPDWKAVAEDVEATLTATGDVTIAEPTQVSPVDLGGGESVMLTWTVTCDGAGDVEFTVTPDGEDENTNQPVIKPDNIDPMSHSIRQEEKIHLTVTDVWTNLEDDTASTEQVFEVYATIENRMIDVTDPDWKAVAEDVEATLTATGAVDIAEPTQVSPVDLGGGESVMLTWTVTCQAAGDVEFTVTPDGEDENTNEPVIAPDNIDPMSHSIRQEEKIHLTVTDVWTNLEDDTASTEQVFEVYATVENRMIAVTDADWKAVAEDVEATLTATGDVSIAEPTQGGTVDLVGGESVMLTWTVTCDGAGDVVFTVTPDGEDENTNAPVIAPDNIDPLSHSILQEAKIHLSVTDVWTNLPNGTIASTEQVFEVYATVENAGEAVAEDVEATLQATGQLDIAEPTQGGTVDLAGDESVQFTWTVTCTGPADVELEVIPDGEDENTNEPVIAPDNVDKGYLSIVQERKAHLVVEIVEPAYGDTFSSDQLFEVRAEVTNTGEATALDVELLLEPLIGDAVLVDGETVTKTVGDIEGGATAVASWSLMCTGHEQVHLWVAPMGIDENTMEAIPEDNLEDDDIIVNQENKALLEASILTPMDGDTFTEGQTFQVRATVENTGQAVALDSQVTLLIDGDAEITSGGETIPMGDMMGSEVFTWTWTLQCTNSGPVTITVTPAGTDENTEEACAVKSDSVVVEQQTAAHLKATVTAEDDTFSTEQEYMVTATIANIGEADADEVEAVITVEGAAELASGEDPTQMIGYLEGEDSIDVEWLLVCTGSGPVTVTVTPAGTEVNRGVPASAESGQVVVNQVAKAHLVTEVSAPAYVAIHSEFVVRATITNAGTAAAEVVYATLTMTEGAELAEGEDAEKMVSPSSLAGGESGEVEWTLVCTDLGDVEITVSPAGDDENTGESIPLDNLEADTVVVEQRPVTIYLPITLNVFLP